MGKIISKLAGFFIQSIVVKSFVLFALYYLVQAILPYLLSLLPTSTNLNELFGLLPNSVWYYLNYFRVTDGIVMVLSALVIRFTVRRLPIVG